VRAAVLLPLVSCVSFRRSLLAKLEDDERFRATSHAGSQWHPIDLGGCRSHAKRSSSTPHPADIMLGGHLV
jgi:hypothetical protein